jgi:hypothetical protein
VPQHVEVDQNPSQRRLLGENLVAHLVGDVAEVEPHDPELHHASVVAPFEHDVPQVDVSLTPAGQHLHLHG